MARKPKKGSRTANLQIRLNQITNGTAQAGPDCPVFVVKAKRLVKLSREQYTRLTEEEESLSYFAGSMTAPENNERGGPRPE